MAARFGINEIRAVIDRVYRIHWEVLEPWLLSDGILFAI